MLRKRRGAVPRNKTEAKEGSGLRGNWIDADLLPSAATFELYDTGHVGIEGVIASKADVEAGEEFRSPLAHNDGAGLDCLSAVGFYAEVLWVTVTAVSCRTAAFICCHGKLPFESLLRCDLSDPQLRKALPVASGSAIIFATLLLENRDGPGASLADDFRGDSRAGNDRLADDQSTVAIQQSNLVDLHGMADIARERLHLEYGPCFHSILFSTCFDNSVHVRPSPRQQNVGVYHSLGESVKN